VHLTGFTIEIYYNARTYERPIYCKSNSDPLLPGTSRRLAYKTLSLYEGCVSLNVRRICETKEYTERDELLYY
jgi:hypothetical protein